jgi:uncharacterized protein YkwD
MVALVVMAAAGPVWSPAPARALSGEEGHPSQSVRQATLKTASETSAAVSAAENVPFPEYDVKSEQLLLELANQSRAQAGEPSLALDAGLTRAARAHAEAMLAAGQLSHRFDGEPTLVQRVVAATGKQLDREGENVALDYDAARGHEHLMLSPPHRANLLDAAYNVVGMAVIRDGNRIYIVQDFGRALPNYSVDQVKEKVAATLAQTRRRANQPALARRDLALADDAACSMAQADKLGTAPVHELAQRYSVLTYTSLYPETLPDNALPTLASHNLRRFSVGACYGRTETYPAGVYWIVLTVE